MSHQPSYPSPLLCCAEMVTLLRMFSIRNSLGNPIKGIHKTNASLRVFLSDLHCEVQNIVVSNSGASRVVLSSQEVEFGSEFPAKDFLDLLKEKPEFLKAEVKDIIKDQISPLIVLDIPRIGFNEEVGSDRSDMKTGILALGGQQVSLFHYGESVTSMEMQVIIKCHVKKAVIWDILCQREEPKVYTSKSSFTAFFLKKHHPDEQ